MAVTILIVGTLFLLMTCLSFAQMGWFWWLPLVLAVVCALVGIGWFLGFCHAASSMTWRG